MLQVFLRPLKLLRRGALEPWREAAGDAEQWRRDPLSHPALAVMSPREIADLPLAGLHARADCAENTERT
ncbi:hypothetical protein [Chelativorans sp.]|uniref:hypothetical protein n=1 Tax=Chelativorans sp. TaxID=2203393 RepID=UPI00281238DE|nr:hypothetical protein [Chelativorans sp.]